MRISYDSEVDAMSIVFRETTVTTKEVAEGIVIEYDSEGRIAGIQVLEAMRRLGGEDTLRRVTVEGVTLSRPG